MAGFLIRIAAAIFAGLLMLSAGCERREPLRIGLNIWPGYDFIFLANELGYFRDEGVDVQIVEFNQLSDARRAYERGQIDGLGTTIVEVLLAAEATTDPLKIVTVVDYSDGADVIIARRGFPDIASFKGQRIGVELGSTCVYVLSRALDHAGLSMADIIPVSKDQVSLSADLRSGQLAAVVTYPPTSIYLSRDQAFDRIYSSAQIPREVIDVIAFGTEAITTRPKDIAAVTRAFFRAQDYYNTHRTDAARILSTREKITPDEFIDALTDGIHIVTQSEQAAYLVEGGIKPILARTAKVLAQTRAMGEPKPDDTYFTAAFISPVP